MAVSPIVNSFMQQGEMPQNGPVDAAQIFTSQFSDMAFNALRAKYPGLINNVITMKTLATDLDVGTAFGVFVVSSGDNVVYVPVAMSDGSITSCEMAYDKEDDQFFPLNDHTVKEILAKSKMSDPTLLSTNPRVEDTRGLFRNMLRPPTSSNVVLASERCGIRSLPDKYKKCFADWLQNDNPRLLGKIASFYNVEELAFKLSPSLEKKADVENCLPEFLRLDSLARDAAELLDANERKAILANGFLVKKAEDAPLIVASPEKLRKTVETEMNLTVYSGTDCNCCREHYRILGGNVEGHRVGKADLLTINANGLCNIPVLVCGYYLFAADGRTLRVSSGFPALLKNLDYNDVNLAGFKNIASIGRLRQALGQFDKAIHLQIHVFVKDRAGNWLFINTKGRLSGRNSTFNITDNTISTENFATGRIVESDILAKGYMNTDNNTLLVPTNSLYMVHDPSFYDGQELNPISSIDKLLSLMSVFGSELDVRDNGAGISITDKKSEKTASFFKRATAAEWLHRNYGMNAAQINSVLAGKRSVIFEKKAFLDPSEDDILALSQQPVEIPAEQGMQGEIAPNPQFSAMEDFAALEDPEIFDSGVLASFAEQPDIKSMLVEYLPDFLAAEDKVGRIILLFSSQKKEIEKFYGAEKCSQLMSSCRRIFSILGELVASLKLYVNMV